MIPAGLEKYLLINVVSHSPFVVSVVEGENVVEIPNGFAGQFVEPKLFVMQSKYKPAGFLVEACSGVITSRLSYYLSPLLNESFSTPLGKTASSNRLKAVMVTQKPMNFFLSVSGTGEYYVQNSGVDARPQIAADTIRILKNVGGNITLRVDAPIALEGVVLEAYVLNPLYQKNPACGVKKGKLIGSTTSVIDQVTADL